MTGMMLCFTAFLSAAAPAILRPEIGRGLLPAPLRGRIGTCDHGKILRRHFAHRLAALAPAGDPARRLGRAGGAGAGATGAAGGAGRRCAAARHLAHRRVRRPGQGGRQGRSARPGFGLSGVPSVQGRRSGIAGPDRLHPRSGAIQGGAGPTQGRGRRRHRRPHLRRSASPARTRADQDQDHPTKRARPARISAA